MGREGMIGKIVWRPHREIMHSSCAGVGIVIKKISKYEASLENQIYEIYWIESGVAAKYYGDIILEWEEKLRKYYGK